MKMTALASIAAGAILLLQPSDGAALPLSCTAGTGGSSATFTLEDAIDVRCYPEEGVKDPTNDSEDLFNDVANGGADPLFGMTGWTLAAKNDGPDGTLDVTFITAPVNDDKSGDWTISSIAGFDKVAIILKAGDGLGAFLVTETSGEWASTKGLSHASIYTIGDAIAVPVPAALPLLLTALGGLAFASRRRRKT